MVGYVVRRIFNEEYEEVGSVEFELGNGVKSKSVVSLVTETVIHNIGYKQIFESNTEPTKQMVGEYEIVNGFLLSHTAASLAKFGRYNDVRMYYSPTHTYCLLRREDNGTCFFAEIVSAPELGEKETKFEPRKPFEVPKIILRDAQTLLRQLKNPHTLL